MDPLRFIGVRTGGSKFNITASSISDMGLYLSIFMSFLDWPTDNSCMYVHFARTLGSNATRVSPAPCQMGARLAFGKLARYVVDSRCQG